MFFPVILLGVLISIGFYIYDPLQVYHKHWFLPENILNDNMRLQAAGLINNYDFDSVIIGNSMLENTSAKEAGQILGGTYMNLSISGGDIYERGIILNYLLKKKKIKTVILQVNPSFVRSGHGAYPVEYWSVLYDDIASNDIKIYLEERFMKCLLTFSQSPYCVGKSQDLDRPAAWYDVPEHKARFGGIDQWIAHHNNEQISGVLNEVLPKNADLAIKLTQDYSFTDNSKNMEFVDEYLISFVRNYPTVRFIFFLPPYSRLSYAIQARTSGLGSYFAWLNYLTKVSEQYSNLEVYGFDDRDFVDDIATYKDLQHYSDAINHFVLQAIAKKDGLLRSDNIGQYIATIQERTEAFDLKKLNDYVQSELRKKEQHQSTSDNITN